MHAVDAVESDASAGQAVREVYRALAGEDLGAGDWPEALHAALSRNEIVFRLNEALATPLALDELPPVLEAQVGRAVTEAEILAWLTLAAAARRDGRPLLRPVVHGFVRGIGGAVVSFPNDTDRPRLWLAAEETARRKRDERLAQFPVATCTVCGQHYYIAFLRDFTYTGRTPGGGDAGPGGPCWERQEEKLGGRRVVLVDTLIGDSDENEEATPHARTAPLHFCRGCGAAHPTAVPRCRAAAAAPVPCTRSPEQTSWRLTSLVVRSAGRTRAPAVPRAGRPGPRHNVADVTSARLAPRERRGCWRRDNRRRSVPSRVMKDPRGRFRLPP